MDKTLSEMLKAYEEKDSNGDFILASDYAEDIVQHLYSVIKELNNTKKVYRFSILIRELGMDL